MICSGYWKTTKSKPGNAQKQSGSRSSDLVALPVIPIHFHNFRALRQRETQVNVFVVIAAYQMTPSTG